MRGSMQRIKELLNLYKWPIIIILVNAIIYGWFGVKSECSRCPMPPMSKAESILFAISGIVVFACAIWIVLIAIAEKNKDI
jgi:hypothetical protein